MGVTSATTGFEAHRRRGPFNAAFFSAMGPFIEHSVRRYKQRVFAGLPPTVVEIGPGVGTNLRYLRPGSTWVAIEPNSAMHGRLRAAAERHGVRLDLRDRVAERTGLPPGSVETVISSLVLCTVTDPAGVVAEVRRVLRPGGTFRFVEHVAARREHPLAPCSERYAGRGYGPFEGCSCERDLPARCTVPDSPGWTSSGTDSTGRSYRSTPR